ncbi:alpha/beta fold hydrolase [Natronomonas marina]|jgi:pimeloyl-ACP methyl ester carboxylesterase|uniref:alpha/beta fold hydrolase n=1 Tax=Natronomonas marina TaxID=2961939 RepID=UPI0020CA1B10|nr:alpha/beta hydrolase [Natronomonas marina]
MNLKRLLGGTAVGIGAVAAGNAALRNDPAELDVPLGRPMETYRWRGFDVAYTEAGDPSNPDLLLLHGINAAASSHEFRYVVDALAEEYHVLAPDIPGFGHSDRPPLMYSGSLYVAFVGDFLREMTDEPTVVASSLSAAYLAAVEDVPATEFVLVCPTATTIPGRRTWLRSLLRSPVVGEGLYNLLASKPSIRYFLADHGFAETASITDEWVEYDWKTAHQAGARFAPASFISGFLDLDVDLGARLAETGVPTTVVWGREAELPPLSAGRELAERADARLVVFDNADLLPHAEHPAEFVDLLV